MAFSAPKLPSNFNFAKLAKYVNPDNLKDLDVFLDNLPKRAGMNGIIVASIIWGIAGGALLMTYTKATALRELRKEMTEAQALTPEVPTLNYVPISDTAIKPQVERLKKVYKNLAFEISGANVKISASSTRDFPYWRAAIGDLAYGGNGWRVQTQQICAGRDCQGTPLQAVLSIQQLDIKIPEKSNQS